MNKQKKQPPPPMQNPTTTTNAIKDFKVPNALNAPKKSQWIECKLGDIADIIGGGTPSTSEPSFWNGNIPWLTPRDLTAYTKIYISRGERSITEKGLSNSSARILPKGTVLITSRAPIGYVAIAENAVCTNQGFKSLVLDNSKAKNKFVYYWVKNNVEYLQSIGTGTTFMEISGGTLRDVSILLPPLSEQEAIAEVLSSLDDKIDLLHRQNTTLEALAQTYFRQWFVEDVSASSNDLNAPTSASTSSPKNEKKLVRLGDYASVTTGKGLSRKDFVENGQYPILGANGEIGRCNNFLYDEKLLITGRVGTHGKVSIIQNKVWISDNVLIISPKKTQYFYAIYFVLKSIDYEAMNVGSTQPLITQTDLKNHEFYASDFQSFNNIVMPFFEKIISNSQQILTLQKLRDTLLPKLITGEIKVKV